LPSIPHRAFEETSHEFLSLGHAWRKHFDVLYVFGLRATLLFRPAIRSGQRVFFNTDGHDWQRRKWGPMASRYLHYSERLGARIAPEHLISDSRAVAAYFEHEYRVHPTYIPYGAPIVEEVDPAPLQGLGLDPGGYYLVLCRIEPENNVDVIVDAFRRSAARRPLIIVGGANYRSGYVEQLRAHASDRIRFLGAIYDRDVVEALYRHSYAYIHGHEVGGTNPSLLQAMGAGCCVLAHDVVYNKEVLGDAGLYWTRSPDELAAKISALDDDPEQAARLGELAQGRAQENYDWDEIAAAYVRYFRAHVGDSSRGVVGG
jgi:glycosyltransferase involved in cell wall biosynthesis